MRRILPCLLAASVAACGMPSLGVTPRYQSFDISGDFGAESGGVSAQTNLDDLGLTQTEEDWGGRVDLKWGSPHLVITGQQASFFGMGTLSSDLSYGGNTITAGTDVDTDLELEIYEAFLLFDLIPGDTLDLGLGFGVGLLGFDIAVTDSLTATTVAIDEDIYLPALAADARVSLGPFEVGALVAAFYYQSGNDEAKYLDGDIFGKWNFISVGPVESALVIGYRYIDAEADYDDGADAVDANFTLQGPYVGLEFRL